MVADLPLIAIGAWSTEEAAVIDGAEGAVFSSLVEGVVVLAITTLYSTYTESAIRPVPRRTTRIFETTDIELNEETVGTTGTSMDGPMVGP